MLDLLIGLLIGLLLGSGVTAFLLGLLRAGGDADARAEAALTIARLEAENAHLVRALRNARSVLLSAQGAIEVLRGGMEATGGDDAA